MSSVLSLPSSSLSSSAVVSAVLALASHARQFLATLFAADSVDTSDVSRLYHAAGETDSVSVAAVNALDDKLKAE